MAYKLQNLRDFCISIYYVSVLSQHIQPTYSMIGVECVPNWLSYITAKNDGLKQPYSSFSELMIEHNNAFYVIMCSCCKLLIW